MPWTPGGQWDLLTFAGVYGGGKKTSPAPTPPLVLTDPVSGRSFVQQVDRFGTPIGRSVQDDLNDEISARQAKEKADSDAAAAKKVQDDADTLAKFNTSKTTAYNNALTDIQRQFTQQGVDPSQYLNTDILPVVNARLSSIKDLDPNPSAAFSPDLGSTIINSITSGKRTSAGNQLNSVFTPTYSQTAIPDSLTGQFSDTLLNEQFDPLNAQLTNAQKRGTLTDAGYNAALGALAQKRTAGASTINDLGSGILSRERSALDDYISGARTSANNLSLSSKFDPNQFFTGATNLVNTDVSGFGGALRNAIGGTKFADIADLINAGGAVQGAQNPTAANPKALPGATAVPEDPNLKRGLGNTGAF
jgi:hypothetical protein